MNEEINKKRMIESLEQLRLEKYPTIPKTLVSEIIEELSQNNGNFDRAQVNVRSIISQHLNMVLCSE